MSRNWTPADLRSQLDTCRKNGLLAMFRASAAKHDLPLPYVLAIASRETNCRNVSGDGGHGHGPMQLDDRSHVIPLGWANDPSGIIDTCCGILQANLIWARRTWPTLTPAQWQKLAADAYNAGPENARRGAEVGDGDLRTTGHDYGSDVLDRMAVFAGLLWG